MGRERQVRKGKEEGGSGEGRGRGRKVREGEESEVSIVSRRVHSEKYYYS